MIARMRVSTAWHGAPVPGRWNEDAYVAVQYDGQVLAAAIDGATERIPTPGLDRLVGGRRNEGATSAWFAARFVRDSVLAKYHAAPRDTLLRANHDLGRRIEEELGALDAARMLDLNPSLDILREDPRFVRLLLPVCVATVARVHLDQAVLEFAHCGDTALLVYRRDGGVEQVSVDQMQRHDQRVLDQATRYWDEGRIGRLADALGHPEIADANLRNGLFHNFEDEEGQPDPSVGVGVINGLPMLQPYLQEGRVDLGDVGAVLLCSDGFMWPAAPGESAADRVQRLVGMRRRIETRGLDGYLWRLRDVETTDDDHSRFPRLKKHDDATAVYLEVLDE